MQNLNGNKRPASVKVVVVRPFQIVKRGEVDGVLQITDKSITTPGETITLDTNLALEVVDSGKAAWPDSEAALTAIEAAKAVKAAVAKAAKEEKVAA